MSIFLLRTKHGSRYAKMIRDAIRKRGVRCFTAYFKDAEKKIQRLGLEPKKTLIHSRTAGPNANRFIESLEKRGFRMINPSRTLDLTSNKFKAHEYAMKHSIPVAETIKVKKTDTSAIQRFLQQHKDIVLKPIFSQGQGVYCQRVRLSTLSSRASGAGNGAGRVERSRISLLSGKKECEISPLALRKAQSSVEMTDEARMTDMPGMFLQLQAFIPYRRLIRAIVIDFKALPEATVYDEPLPGEWKCSVCLNPRIKKLENPPVELMMLAEKTARAFDARINFIDFFETANGEAGGPGRFILNEINTACNLIRHEMVTGVPIHEKIAEFLMSQI